MSVDKPGISDVTVFHETPVTASLGFKQDNHSLGWQCRADHLDARLDTKVIRLNSKSGRCIRHDFFDALMT
jgi:hypothetical protein